MTTPYLPGLVDPLIEELLAGFSAVLVVGPGVDKELRSAERNDPLPARGQRAELQGGKKIVTLKIGIVRESIFDGHSRRQKFQQRLDRVT